MKPTIPPQKDPRQELIDAAKALTREFEDLKASLNALKVAYCVRFARSPDDVPSLLAQIDEYKQRIVAEKLREIDLIAEVMKRRVQTGSVEPDA